MPWMHKLYETYLANEHLAGDTSIEPQLSLPAHIPANSQITVTIDKNGNFKGAVPVPKELQKIMIPVTEKSSGRSSGVAPHSLCDMLPYVAGDFASYVDSEKEKKKSIQKFEEYSAQLQSWVESEYSHTKAKAVFEYIRKECMVKDLIQSGIIKLGEDGKFDKSKVNGASYDKAIVRFRVMDFDSENENVWEDKTLFNSYINYYMSSSGAENGICYVTGKDSPLCANHPKGIVANSYGAKLISANDTSNFVYRGRFTTGEQALSVSYEVSQKAHSALTWLVAKQGVRISERVFVCWNPNGKDVFFRDDLREFDEDDEDSENNIDLTAGAWRKRIRKLLNGYREDITDSDDIVIIALEAATTGRLSVTYYNELKGSDYYDRIQFWGENLNWRYGLGKKSSVCTPPLKKIIRCAYGTEQNGLLNVSDKLLSEQYQRLLHCMLDKKPIPKDILHALFINACNPMKYKLNDSGISWNFEDVLSTTCAVKNFIDNKGKDDKMILDEKNTDRSYIFGRLLAIADIAEQRAHDKNENRETNAMRLWSAYVNHPLATFNILRKTLAPYYKKIGAGSRIFYENMLAEVFIKIPENNTDINRPLDENFILGYYLQRAELMNKNKDSKEEKENDITE